jgi:precorrin-2 dehydrogenase/sirohydrochlorin ferrochelatase
MAENPVILFLFGCDSFALIVIYDTHNNSSRYFRIWVIYMSKFYPIHLNVTGKKCVIIGGGKVAYRKVRSLKESGADVVVVSPEVCPEMVNEEGLVLIKKEYEECFLDGALLVIAATDNETINKKVTLDAERRNIIVNVVDYPERCSFIVPSTINRGDLCISISTGGASPAVSKRIREELETVFGKEYEEYLDLLTKMRSLAMSSIENRVERRKVLQRLAKKDIFDAVKDEGVRAVEAKMREIISG